MTAYTNKEKQFIRDNYGNLPVPQIAAEISRISKINRGKQGIYSFANRNGLVFEKRNCPWSEDEDNFIHNNYLSMTQKDMAVAISAIYDFDRTASSVNNRIMRLGLKPAGKKKIKYRPIIPDPAINIEFNPVIKSLPLLRKMDGLGISLKDIARVSGASLNLLQNYVRMGGLPKEFIKPVERLCGGM